MAGCQFYVYIFILWGIDFGLWTNLVAHVIDYTSSVFVFFSDKKSVLVFTNLLIFKCVVIPYDTQGGD